MLAGFEEIEECGGLQSCSLCQVLVHACPRPAGSYQAGFPGFGVGDERQRRRPSHEGVFTGIHYDSVKCVFHMAQSKVESLVELTAALLEGGKCSRRELASSAGRLGWFCVLPVLRGYSDQGHEQVHWLAGL